MFGNYDQDSTKNFDLINTKSQKHCFEPQYFVAAESQIQAHSDTFNSIVILNHAST